MSEIRFKECCECERMMPAGRFLRHPHSADGYMAMCRHCYGGGVVVHRSSYPVERMWGDPTEADIADACTRIQSKWSEAKRARRRSIATSLSALKKEVAR